ncbi:MAG: vitamin K-dependent gamma-carboxylase [Myxococcales bacterium]|nr:vitamin K-dependent gamma-carboxylase [Myxococcales bacterium]
MSRSVFMGRQSKLAALAFRRIDIAGLVVFRIVFGLLMAFETLRYLALGWVRDYYTVPSVLLKYLGFWWLKTPSAPVVYAVFALMTVAALGIALGAFYRLSVALFLVTHTYAFLLAGELYLNHAYLLSLVALLLLFAPAHRAVSVDAQRDPSLYARSIEAWPVLLVTGLVSLVYVFGGVAKFNLDWLAGEPIRHWLQDAAQEMPSIAPVLTSELAVNAIVFGGLAFDLTIVPLIVWRRTRALGVVLSVAFHVTNALIFHIGVFPWFMLAVTSLYCSPRWPYRMPVFGPELSQWLAAPRHLRTGTTARAAIAAFALVFFTVQLLVPLRHWLYRGDVAWTEEGHFFSWRMKLRDKRGRVSFRVRAADTGESWHVDLKGELTGDQLLKLASKPDFVLFYAHLLRDRYRRSLGRDVEVYADAFASLNYRPEQRFIDPAIDLASVTPSLAPSPWILPLTTPRR